MCCSPWGHKELDTTEQLNWTQLWGEASGLTEVIPLICTSAIRESPWTEETGRLQSMGSQRVRHDWATKHTCLFSYLRPVSRVLTSWVFWGLTIGSGCSLMVSEMAAILLPEFPGAYQLTIKWLLQSLMTVASFVYRYGRKYSISYLLLPRSLNPDPSILIPGSNGHGQVSGHLGRTSSPLGNLKNGELKSQPLMGSV